jgi:hypothetical protein
VSSSAELVDAPLHDFERHGFGYLVVFIAITTGEIAAPHRNDVRQHYMIRVEQRLGNEGNFTKFQLEKRCFSALVKLRWVQEEYAERFGAQAASLRLFKLNKLAACST